MKRWKKWLSIFVKVTVQTVETCIALAIVAGGLALGRLYIDPVEIKDFLPTLEKHLLPSDSGLKLDADSMTLRASFEDNGILHIAIKNLSVIREDGATALKLPQVDMAYRWRHIFRLNYLPSDIGIRGAFLQLLIDPDGRFHIYSDRKSVSEKTIKAQETGLVIDQKKSFESDAIIRTFRNFDRITLDQAQVTIDDRQKDQKLSLPSVNLAIERQPERNHAIQLSAVANINQDLTNLSLEAQLDRAKRKMSFDVEWDRLDAKNLTRLIPELAEANLVIRGRLKGILDFGSDCQDIVSCFKEGTFTVKTVEPGTLNLPEPLSNLYRVQSATINGAISDHFAQIKIARSSLKLVDGPAVDLTVDITGADQCLSGNSIEGIQTVLKAHISSLPITQVPSVWPAACGPDAHAWVKENLTAGTVEYADFTLNFKGDELVDVYGELPVKNVKVRYMDEMTPVQNMSGLVKLYLDRVYITGTGGNIGHLVLSSAIVDLTEIQEDIPHAKITLDVVGPVREALDLISEKPLEFPQEFGLDTKQTDGQSKIYTTFSFPMKDDLDTKDITITLNADIQNGVFPTPFDDYPLTESQLHLSLDNDKLVVEGTGTIGGLPLSLKWTELFNAVKPKDIHAKYDLAVTTTTDKLTPYIANLENFVSGTVTVKGTLNQTIAGKMSGNAQWDATKALVHVYPLSYTKQPDVALTASTDFDYNKDTLTLTYNIKGITDFESLDPVSVQGTAKINNSFELNLKEVSAPQTDIQNSSIVLSDHSLKVRLNGKSWKAFGLYDWPTDTESSPLEIPNNLNIDIKLDQLTLAENKPITNISIFGIKEENLWQSLSVDMTTDEDIRLSFSPEYQKLTMNMNDLGDFLSRLNITDQMEKGKLSLKAKQQKEGGFKGVITIKKLSLKDTGFFLQAATILGIFDAIRGQNLLFDEGQIPFIIHPKSELTISLEDAYLSGVNLGITTEGKIAAEKIKLSGSVIPAYAINSLPGKIPLIGGLFRDGDGGGLIGVKYDVTGSPTQPDVSFDPLKSIAPGILGKLFK